MKTESKDLDDSVDSETLRKLFIGGLDYSTTDEELRDFYAKWGELTDYVVMKDPRTRISRGFGFVTYALASSVDLAMANRPHTIKNKLVEPKRAIPREICDKSSAGVRKLFIGGITKMTEKEDLEAYFSKFGKLKDCAVVTSKETGEKRGFGFVEYEDVDAADKVVLMKDHEVLGRKVDVKKAIAQDQMRRGGGGGGGSRGGNMRSGPRGGGGGGGGWNNQSGWYSGYGDGGYNNQWGSSGGNQGWGGGGGGGGGGSSNNMGWDNSWGNQYGYQQGQGGYQQQNSGFGMNQQQGGGFGQQGPEGGKGFRSGGFGGEQNGPTYQTPTNYNSGGNGSGSGGPIRNNFNTGNRSTPYPQQNTSKMGGYGGHGPRGGGGGFK